VAPGETSSERLLRVPGMQQVPVARLQLFLLRGFLEPNLCDALIEQITANRRPSTIADDTGEAAFRTSETCDLDPGDPLVARLDSRLAALTGIAPEFGEPIQGQRYEVGQEFKPHTDYFEPHGPDFARYCSLSGQRTWTAMIYLNDVPAGGGTRFKAIGKTIRPEAGKLLIWNNRLADGTPNGATLHQGMKVRAGCKYVLTRWYRERPWV
jgi:prolyl 4-hydroxylase